MNIVINVIINLFNVLPECYVIHIMHNIDGGVSIAHDAKIKNQDSTGCCWSSPQLLDPGFSVKGVTRQHHTNAK